ncbi:MAG: hypothetical protein AB1505_07545, partial [Candidatus Latescibacterota bacterium]
MDSGALRVGVAAGDITPPVGIHMGGYWGRRSGATGIHDPLQATVLVLGAGLQRAAVVALDLVGLQAATVAGLRARMETGAGIPAGACLVCCSHTHAGPLTAG